MADQQLDELIRQCTVKICTNGGHGTGFFVAPGIIITCAHVVEIEQLKSIIDVYWKKQLYKAKIKKIRKESSIDLALLELTSKINHPCVYLDRSTPNDDHNFSVFGYSEKYPDGDIITCQYEGEIEADRLPLYKFKGGQFTYGFSGSALFNKTVGKVCGVVYASRNIDTDLGGNVVPVKTILDVFSDIEVLNLKFHQNQIAKNYFDYINKSQLSYKKYRAKLKDLDSDHRKPEVRKKLKKEIGLNKKEVGYNINILASKSLETGNFEIAINRYQEAIEMNAKDASAYAGLGASLYKQGKMQESINSLIKAKELCVNQGMSQQAEELDAFIKSINVENNFFSQVMNMFRSFMNPN
jgi:Trypsin-like peptidase domain/TPR repeat